MKKIYEFEWTCTTVNGIHAAEGAKMIGELQKTQAEVLLVNKETGVRVDGRSILGLLSLAIEEHDDFEIWVNGSESDYEAIKEIFLTRGFIANEIEKN